MRWKEAYISKEEIMNKVVELLIKNNKTISTMESCTGGALVNAITNIPEQVKYLNLVL